MAQSVPPCAPPAVEFFRLERELEVRGVHADIRHYGWADRATGIFRTDSYYIDMAIGPRNTSARLRDPRSDRLHTPGDVVFLPKDSEFSGMSAAGEHSLLCLTVDQGRAARLIERDGLLDIPPCFDVRATSVRAGLARLLEELRNPGFGQDVLLESVAMTILVDLCRHFRADEAPAGGRGSMPDWRLRRIKERIESDLSNAVSIADLAVEVRTSTRHMIRTFKAATGLTLTEYVARRRMARAMEMLRGRDSIKGVAQACGFRSPAAFSAAFRKVTGLTPRQYRDEYGVSHA